MLQQTLPILLDIADFTVANFESHCTKVESLRLSYMPVVTFHMHIHYILISSLLGLYSFFFFIHRAEDKSEPDKSAASQPILIHKMWICLFPSRLFSPVRQHNRAPLSPLSPLSMLQVTFPLITHLTVLKATPCTARTQPHSLCPQGFFTTRVHRPIPIRSSGMSV